MPRGQSTRPEVERIGPPEALRRLPDILHRAARRAYPNEPIRCHQSDPYQS